MMTTEKMTAQQLIDSLFKDYEKTKDLIDLKEELLSNFNAKMANFRQKGMSEAEAFNQAKTELGDVATLAEEMALKRCKNVFQEAYMGKKPYLSKVRAGCYTLFGFIAFFGLMIALIASVATIGNDQLGFFSPTFWGPLIAFWPIALAGFTFLWVTQESAKYYAVSKIRAIFYTLSVTSMSFGLLVSAVTCSAIENFERKAPLVVGNLTIAENVSSSYEAIIVVLAVALTFILPGLALLIFMVLTEQDRKKPWCRPAPHGGER